MVRQIQLFVLLCALFSGPLLASSKSDDTEYVGGEACVTCHAEQAKLWRPSHHALAMQHANKDTVLGDFNDRQFSYNGIESRFYQRDGRFFVATDGPDGKLAEYEIKHTFGVDPLQQYLVAFPGGRLQALGIAWDARPREQGGQRWFHLYPDEKIDHQDELHWTGRRQNWNFMCAECHSTELKKNYDPKSDAYRTTWSEINVSCEACHGPGRKHVAWAQLDKTDKRYIEDKSKGLPVRFEPFAPGRWRIDPNTGNAVRTEPIGDRTEIETCARCHSRRGALTDNYVHGKSILDTHRVALLEPDLYFADGQIRDEVYVYGSFLQSRMYHKGVNCSDCHEPHSLALRAPAHQVCLTCHAADKYNNAKHHFHATGTPGASCVECHMPTRTYMVVDPRRDHSLRIPRPDLSIKLGSSNACTACHKGQSSEWALDKMRGWYGEGFTKKDHYGSVLAAGERGEPGIARQLWGLAREKTAPGIVRATAAGLLPRYLGPESMRGISLLLEDEDPLVRMAVLRMVDAVDPRARLPLAAASLADPVRSVRSEAMRVLSLVPATAMSEFQREEFEHARAEYIKEQQFNADQPEAHLNLGLLYARQRQTNLAEAAYQQAIQMDPQFVPAYVNLADLYRALGRDTQGEQVLRAALKEAPGSAAVHHALGLLLVRRKQTGQALPMLARAAELQPDNARYSYVYAVALNSGGDSEKALAVLRQAHQASPNDRDILAMLVSIHRDRGEMEHARPYLEKLRAWSAN